MKDIKNKIAIIGGGPAGVCLGLQFKRQALPDKPIELLIFEKNASIGSGLPYALENENDILNLPKEEMNPLPAEKNQFSNWLAAHAPQDNKTTYPLRRYFGKYLQDLALHTQLEAAKLGVNIRYLTNNEVLDVVKKEKDIFQIISCQGVYEVNQIILAIGHMPVASYSEFLGKSGYIADPWHVSELKTIPLQEPIVIIGSRLTAIDTALNLRQLGHVGSLTMVSRSGLLPTVLGKEIPLYSLKYLNLDTLMRESEGGKKKLSLKEVKHLFWCEFSEIKDQLGHLATFPKSIKNIHPYDWITREIKEAEQGARCWQQIAFQVYPLAPTIWSLLDEHSKQHFLKHDSSLFINYIASFPLENAYKIKEMLYRKELQVLGELNQITYESNHFKINTANSVLKTNYLINATGPGYDAVQIPLLSSMIQQRLIAPHPFGGIQVDRTTLQIMNGNKKHRGMYALGELTKGVSYLTTDFNVLAHQAEQLVKALMLSLSTP